MKPHPLVTTVLTKLSNIIPTWKIIPTQDVIDAAFRLPQVRKEVKTLDMKFLRNLLNDGKTSKSRFHNI